MIFAVDMIVYDSAPARCNILEEHRCFLDAEIMFPHCPYSSGLPSCLFFYVLSENEVAPTTTPFSGVPEIQEKSLIALSAILKGYIQRCFRWCLERLYTLRDLGKGLLWTVHWWPIKTLSAIFRYRLRRGTLRDRFVWHNVSVLWLVN